MDWAEGDYGEGGGCGGVDLYNTEDRCVGLVTYTETFQLQDLQRRPRSRPKRKIDQDTDLFVVESRDLESTTLAFDSRPRPLRTSSHH